MHATVNTRSKSVKRVTRASWWRRKVCELRIQVTKCIRRRESTQVQFLEIHSLGFIIDGKTFAHKQERVESSTREILTPNQLFSTITQLLWSKSVLSLLQLRNKVAWIFTAEHWNALCLKTCKKEKNIAIFQHISGRRNQGDDEESQPKLPAELWHARSRNSGCFATFAERLWLICCSGTIDRLGGGSSSVNMDSVRNRLGFSSGSGMRRWTGSWRGLSSPRGDWPGAL